MAVTVVSNRAKIAAWVHVNAANGTIVIAGNNSVSTIAAPNETILGAYITQAFWGAGSTGQIQLRRNGVLVAGYDSSGYFDYSGNGVEFNINSTANVDITFTDPTIQTILIELQKVCDYSANTDYFKG